MYNNNIQWSEICMAGLFTSYGYFLPAQVFISAAQNRSKYYI